MVLRGAIGTDQHHWSVESIGEFLNRHVAESHSIVRIGNKQQLIFFSFQALSQFEIVTAGLTNAKSDIDKISQTIVVSLSKWPLKNNFPFFEV